MKRRDGFPKIFRECNSTYHHTLLIVSYLSGECLCVMLSEYMVWQASICTRRSSLIKCTGIINLLPSPVQWPLWDLRYRRLGIFPFPGTHKQPRNRKSGCLTRNCRNIEWKAAWLQQLSVKLDTRTPLPHTRPSRCHGLDFYRVYPLSCGPGGVMSFSQWLPLFPRPCQGCPAVFFLRGLHRITRDDHPLAWRTYHCAWCTDHRHWGRWNRSLILATFTCFSISSWISLVTPLPASRPPNIFPFTL